MFRLNRLVLAISPFSLFLMDNKKNPQLKDLSIGVRGKTLSKMYKSLSATDRKKLQARADRHPSFKKKVKKPKANDKRRKYSGGDFAIFWKKNYSKVRKLPIKQRLPALGQLYALQKPINIAEELAKLSKKKPQPAKKQIKSKAKAAKKGKKSKK
ncbi:hypothetical protein ADEAN_000064200 [Angomonas deanei]|uniref:HMG box domain-containing protein n=1 Tax=Angomonas deanei TaxID=59799 RepID=A0A7G2C0Z6_9TRYP|nr:hypothetical protein ADEAN_000064200 [Angomonas deanei]